MSIRQRGSIRARSESVDDLVYSYARTCRGHPRLSELLQSNGQDAAIALQKPFNMTG
jgi:hypothetical protein